MTGRHTPRVAATAPPDGTDSDQLGVRVRRGAAWSVAASLFLRLSSVVTTAIVAHIFDRSEFGVFTIALTANTIVTIVGQFGLTSCLTRADLDIDSMAPTMLTFSVVTNLIQAGAMFVFAQPIATALGSAAAAGPVRVLAIAQVIVGFAEIPNCQLARNFGQRKLFLAQVVGSVPSTVVLLTLALSGAGPVAYAWSMDFGIFLSACVVFASAGRYYLPGLRRSALGVLFRYGFPLGMANIVNVVLLNVDYALIGHLVGPAALGSYVLAFNVASWPASLLGTMLNWIGIPTFSRVKDDQQAVAKAVVTALRAFSLVVFPMSTMTAILCRPLVVVFYGSKWTMSASVLQVLAVYGAASVMCTLLANILAGLGRSKILVIVQLAWLGLLLPAMTIGITIDGIYGAAIAHVVVVALVIPCYLAAVKRVTRVGLAQIFRAILPALAASLVAGLAAGVVASQFRDPPVQLAIGMATGILVYTLAVAPQVVALVSRVGARRARVVRVLRTYNRAARLVGLPGYSPAKHTRRSSSSREEPRGTGAIRPGKKQLDDNGAALVKDGTEVAVHSVLARQG
jgi:lipopolysaccharide exporter